MHTTWIETVFSETLAKSPELAAAAPDAARKTITIDVDGKAMRLGLPQNLLAALLSGGGARGGGQDSSAEAVEAGDDSELVSPINGNLVKWLAHDGASVEEGDPVAVLEAMKMETQVNAHRAGTLSRGDQEPGARVARAEVLGKIS